MDSHLQFLATNPINEELGVDFDEIMKDAKYFNGNAAAYAPAGSDGEGAGSGSFSTFSGDPQDVKNLHLAEEEVPVWEIPHLADHPEVIFQVILQYIQRILVAVLS